MQWTFFIIGGCSRWVRKLGEKLGLLPRYEHEKFRRDGCFLTFFMNTTLLPQTNFHKINQMYTLKFFDSSFGMSATLYYVFPRCVYVNQNIAESVIRNAKAETIFCRQLNNQSTESILQYSSNKGIDGKPDTMIIITIIE